MPLASEATVAETPRACDLLVRGARILTPESAEAVLEDAAVAVRGGVIVDVGTRSVVEASWSPARTIDAAGQVLAPGFVDAHVHLGAFLGAGRPYQPSTGPGPFSGAGKVQVILPMIVNMCQAPVPDELVAEVVRPALAAMLHAGFTGVVDAGGPGVAGVVAAADELGIRAAIGPSLADLWHDKHGRLIRQKDADRVLAGARETITAYPSTGRVRPLVSAVEAMACSDELLAGIAELTAEHDLPTHVHSHISTGAVHAHDTEFGRSATQRLRQAGLLTPRCTVMHAGCLTDEDIEVFSETGVTVNYNPTGNAMLGFGITPGRSVPRLLAAGVPIALGSDYAPSAVAAPFDMIRAALMLQRDSAARDDALTLEQALTMATNGGHGLGQPARLGHVGVGQLADLVLVDTSGLHHLGTQHPVPALALHARADDVTTVIVDGHVVIEDRQLTGHDEAGLATAARHAHAAIHNH